MTKNNFFSDSKQQSRPMIFFLSLCINVSSTNSDQSNLSVNNPLYTRLLLKQTIASKVLSTG